MNLLDKFYSNRRSLCEIFFKITPNTREFPHKREPFVHVGEVHLLHIMLHNAMACANVPCHKPKSRRCFFWLQNWKPMFGIKSGIWNISLGKAKYIQIVPNMLLNHRRLFHTGLASLFGLRFYKWQRVFYTLIIGIDLSIPMITA